MAEREIFGAHTKVKGGYVALEQRIGGYDYEINNANAVPENDDISTYYGSVSFNPDSIDYIEGIDSVEQLLDKVGSLTIPEVREVFSIHFDNDELEAAHAFVDKAQKDPTTFFEVARTPEYEKAILTIARRYTPEEAERLVETEQNADSQFKIDIRNGMPYQEALQKYLKSVGE